MLRQGSTPLRFAHSSGALTLDQATRTAMQGAFAGLAKPPVVLQAMPSLDGAGIEPAGVFAAEATAIAGGRAIVVASGGPVDRLKRIGAEFHALPLDNKGPVAIGRNAGRLKRLMEELDVDIVHARNREIAWAARQATRSLSGDGKVRLVTSVGGDMPFRDAGRDGGALLEGDCIVAGSAHVRDVIANSDMHKQERISVIPDGVDLAHFTASAISSERLTRLARGWGMLEEPAPTILAPGPIDPLRGQHVLARALGLLRDEPRLAGLVTIIAGDAGQKNSYAEQLGWIVRKGRAGGVFLSAAIADMPAAIMLSDLVVSLPTDPLGQDPTAAMALALGKPVVGANHGATAEVVVDGQTGRIASPTDPEAVAAALRDLLTMSPMARNDASAASRARAEAYFSAAASALATVRLYGALLASGKASTRR